MILNSVYTYMNFTDTISCDFLGCLGDKEIILIKANFIYSSLMWLIYTDLLISY